MMIDRLCELLRQHYVHADRADAMCRALTRLRGDNRAQSDGCGFAALLTEHLHGISPDPHLRVRWFEQAPPEVGSDEAASHEMRRMAAVDDNQGIHRVERLAGNVGLLDVREFHPPDGAATCLAAAMTLLQACTALVFDLRRCRGGEPETVALLATYLFGAEPVHLNDLYVRAEDRTQSFYTRPARDGPRCPGTPVYVACSRETFSAGEEFAYDLQALGRAIVVGEPTRGGAQPGRVHRLDEHYAVFIPDARAVNPVTGTNWEGCGVLPDIPCAARDAVDVAHRRALQALMALPAGAVGALSAALREEARAQLATGTAS
jgi:C-terminal processing protease CtpA/Prc